jgi:iron complex outermembrane receptor protein
MRDRRYKQLSGVALLAIISSVLPGIACAQGVTSNNSLPPAVERETAAPTPAEASEIIVTGTSIRGVAPVGSNLISVSTEALAATGQQTVTGALQSIPSLSGTTGQGVTSAFYQPSIHQLGASASNSTLVLIDGHRGPTGGTNHTFLDPNIVPFNMLQRVEVLAEGASSVYGSDAVAGVINFITRKRFDGIQADGSITVRDGMFGHQAGLLVGRSWDTGSAVFGATYIHQDNLKARDRDFTYPDQTGVSVGNGLFGSNFLSPFCDPAQINTNVNRCTNWAMIDLLGKENRQNVMGKITLEPTDKLTLGLDLLYARRRGTALGANTTLQATAFQAGAQANPFFTGIGPSQTIRYDTTYLFGPARNRNDSDSMYAAFTASYALSGDWTVDLLGSAGRDESSTFSQNAVNGSAALLALNGTTNGAGSLTTPSIPGSTTIVTQLPLTTANALDVWSAAGANRTSSDTRARLLDNTNLLRNTTGYQQARLSLSGTLFNLWAGPVKVAIGGEMYNTQLGQFVSRSNAGPARTNSQQLRFDFDRKVYSGYMELNVPLISEEMDIPFVHKLDLSLAGRYDHYDDFGSTTNPKIGFNWDVARGFRLRGNYSTSFVAPPLTILGDQFGAFGTANWVPGVRNVTVDTALFPDARAAINNAAGSANACPTTTQVCSLAAVNGIQVTRGDPGAKAQNGDGWSLGVDLAPPQVPGLRAAITYWRTNFSGGVTGSQIEQVLGIRSANYLATFYPNCATQAQIETQTTGIPQAGQLASCTAYIYQTLNTNWLNLRIGGIDYQIDYDLKTDKAGTFSGGISGTEFTKYTQSFGSGATYDILNTAGNNGTFASVKRRMRGYAGWGNDDLVLRMFANYIGSFRNWASTSTRNPLTRDSNGNPNGGGDRVKALTTFDINAVYQFNGGLLNGSQLSLAATNIFDKNPPYYNVSSGYYSLVHNPYGRTVTLSLTVKLM